MTPNPTSPQAHGFELNPLIGFFPRVSDEDHGSASLFEGGTMVVDGALPIVPPGPPNDSEGWPTNGLIVGDAER